MARFDADGNVCLSALNFLFSDLQWIIDEYRSVVLLTSLISCTGTNIGN